MNYRAIVASLALSMPAAHGWCAAPMLFKTCENYKSQGSAGLVLFSEDCGTAFLLPGSTGSLEVTGSFFSITDDLCSSVQAAESAALGAFGDAASRQQRRSEVQSARDQIATAVGAAQAQIDQLQRAKSAITEAAAAAAETAKELESRFQSDCNGDQNKNFGCFGIASDLAKQTAISKKGEQQLELIQTNVSELGERVASLNDKDKQLQTELEKLESSTTTPDEQAAAVKVIQDLRKQQGAVISATLTTPLAEELSRARSANASTGIDVEQMRFNAGSLYVAGLDQAGAPQLLGAPTIIVPGQVVDGGGTLFINAAGGQINLDAVAACQAFAYKRPTAVTNKDVASKVAAALVAKAYLNYSALLRATVTVKMDYNRFYELLVSTDSKNGFFRTSTVKSVEEKMRGDNTLSVEVVDEGHVLSDEEKDALQSGMRDRVVQRALSFLNPTYVGVDPNASPAPPTAGAGKLAAELRRCPNQWCQVGAVVVDVANSIFGGSASRQSFVQTLGVKSEETYSNDKTFDFVTDFAFEPQ